MKERLHLVFGGELVDPAKNKFRNLADVEVVGLYPSHQAAYDAWKAASQASVDNAHMRYYIAHLHRLLNESSREGDTSPVTDE